MKYVLNKNSYVVEYYVTENKQNGLPPYGIKVMYNNEVCDKMDNLFFTKDEALGRCKWLVENDVLPEIFRDVMADIMLWHKKYLP